MYKNQLQELAQRSCFNLPSYTCVREGPDHAPRFRATVNFNGEFFDSPSFCTTLRQAEHSAAEVALNSLSTRGPSISLAAKILDETGVYKNLLQEVAQRVGAALPVYTTFRSGLGHLPVFTCAVELAEFKFTGEPAKNKKQAEKNAAMAAWLSLKQLAQQVATSSSEKDTTDEQEHVTVARALLKYRLQEKMATATANTPRVLPFPKKFSIQHQKPPNTKPLSANGSKILPLIRPRTTPRNKTRTATTAGVTNGRSPSSSLLPTTTMTTGVANGRSPLSPSMVPAATTTTAASATVVTNDRSASSSTILPATTTATTGVTKDSSPLSPSLLLPRTTTDGRSVVSSSLIPAATSTGITSGRSSSPSSILPATTTVGVDNGRFQLSSSLLPAVAKATGVANCRTSVSSSFLPDNHGSSFQKLDNLRSILKKLDDQGSSLQKFPTAGAPPNVPVHSYRAPYHGMAPPVTIRTAVPVFSTPPLPPPANRPAHINTPALCAAPPVNVRPVVPVFASPAPGVQVDKPPVFMGPPNNPLIQMDGPLVIPCHPSPNKLSSPMEEIGSATANDLQETAAVQNMKELKI